MPTYEYECKSCGHLFEKFQPITSSPCKKCPKCGKEVRRLIGAGAAVIFKGSGFYATDYRSADYKKREKEEKGEAKKEKSDKKDSSNSGKSKEKGGKNNS